MPEPALEQAGTRITFRELGHKSRELESRSPAEDTGIFHIDSPDGEFLMVNADKLQAQAEERMREERFQNAVESYSDAILGAVQVRSNCIQQAMLFRGRSRAYCKMEKHELALKDASMVVLCMPTYEQGFVHFVQVLWKMGKFGEAFSMAREAFSRPLDHRLQVEYLALLVQIHAKVKDRAEILRVYEFPSGVWNDLVQKLVSDRCWEGLILMLKCPETWQHVTALATRDVNLSDIVFSPQASSKAGPQDLVLVLLKAGASYKSVCPQRKYPLHTALKVASKTGTYELFNYMLELCDVDEQKACDDKGNSLLHLICSSSIKQTKRHVVIQRLLKTDLDPSVTNLEGKMAHQLLPENDPDVQNILKHIGKKAPEDQQESSTRSSDHHVVTDTGSSGRVTGARLPCEEWDRTCVQDWLVQQDLGTLSHRLHECDGPMLLELRTMLSRAPAVYIRLMGTKLGLNPAEILALSAGLRQLPA